MRSERNAADDLAYVWLPTLARLDPVRAMWMICYCVDDSSREDWADIARERVMRRAIARELSRAANDLYSVNQESVTGEEMESDIRLCSRASDHEAVIELKLAEKWSARELRDAIGSQLVEKYLVTENRSTGCLLVTLAIDRTWKHPDTGARIGPSELKTLLCEEAERVMDSKGRTVTVAVHILDLRKPSSDSGL